MAEDGALATGQDGRHPVAFARERAAADRVDAAVDAMEAAAVGAVLNRAPAETQRPQLSM
jgi:hypothetical protein